MTEKCKKHIIPVLILAITAIAISFSTLFCYYSKGYFGHDAGIFAYIGYAITKGKVLYTGAWDNKGPLLYFINALGILINYRYGIWILEIIALFATLLFMYKTALLFTDRYISVISAVFSLLPLSVCLEGGNLSEEWALPFTAMAFYFIASFYKCGITNSSDFKLYKLFFVGIGISAVFLLRLNILAFLAVAVLGAIITAIKNRQFTVIFKSAAIAFAGFTAFLLPFIIYLIKTKSFSDCLQSAYFGALGAFSNISLTERITNIYLMIKNFFLGGGYVILPFIVISPYYLYKTRGTDSPIRSLLYISYGAMFATLIANSLSGASHMHYFMSFIPVMIIPVVWFMNGIYNYLKKGKIGNLGTNAIITVLTLILVLSPLEKFYNNIINNLYDGTLIDGKPSYYNSEEYNISEYVKARTTEDDTVLLFGPGSAATSYYRAKRLAASNYFYYANGRFSDKTKNEFANGILNDAIENHPKIILFTSIEKLEDFISHLDNKQTFEEFLNANYHQDVAYFSSIIYLHK